MEYSREQLKEMLSAYMEDTLPEGKRRELMAQIAAQQDNELWTDLISEINAAKKVVTTEENLQPLLTTILNRIHQQEVSKEAIVVPIRNRRWISYAAAILLLIGAGTVIWLMSNKEQQQQIVKSPAPSKNELKPPADKAILTLSDGRKVELVNDSTQVIAGDAGNINNRNGEILYEENDVAVINTLSTAKGGQFKLTLADGTRVWLNATSSITYPTAFTGNERNVSIDGEVYFEVAKDRSKPFIVQSRDLKVQVLGTHFNVMAYKEENETRTTLLEGSVKVVAGKDSLVLKPSAQALLSGEKNLTTINHVETANVIAWIQGDFHFENAGIRQIMNQVARWYDVSIQYEKQVEGITLSGKLSKKNTFTQLLEILEATHQVAFDVKDNRITVKPYKK